MKKLLFSFFVLATVSYVSGCTTKTTRQETEVSPKHGWEKIEDEMKEMTKKETVLHFNFPKDYKNWTHGTSKIILDKSSPLYGFQQVFVNDTAIDAYKRGNGYPEGSTIIIGFYDAVVEGEEIRQGDIIWYAGMKKDSMAEKTGGWIFDGFDGKTLQSKIDDPINGCYLCHTAKKDRDYVFTSFTGKISTPLGVALEASSGRFIFPVDMRSWYHSNSKVNFDKNSPLYGFQQIYVNDIGYETNKTSGTYPEGSILTVGFYEPIKDGNSISQGDIIWYASMKKDSKVGVKTGGWIFDGFDGESLQSTIEDPISGCFICHTAKKNNDYIFSEYIP